MRYVWVCKMHFFIYMVMREHNIYFLNIACIFSFSLLFIYIKNLFIYASLYILYMILYKLLITIFIYLQNEPSTAPHRTYK